MNALITIDNVPYEHNAELLCPVCAVALWVSVSDAAKPVHIFCGNGSCESQVTRDGGEGKDFIEAMASLAKNVEEEQMRAYWNNQLLTDAEFEEMERARTNTIKYHEPEI